MKTFLPNLSLVPKGLRYKLMIAYCLMAVIPLLICVYLASTYIFPHTQNIFDISLVMLITVGITFLGLCLAREIVEPMIKLAMDARIIAEGDINRMVEVKGEDEIGDLGRSLNTITRRIKENMDELRSYGEKTKQINTEIHKKVLTMTGLLQIGNLISSAIELDKILEFSVEKIMHLPDITGCFLMMLDEDEKKLAVKSLSGLEETQLTLKKIRPGEGLVGKIAKQNKPFILDADTKTTTEIEDFRNEFQLTNCALFPVVSAGKTTGVLGVGNTIENYKFTQDDLELFEVFVKQMGIAVENDILIKKAEELEITDELTGLYNESYINARLDEEIKRAIIYQRPCAFIILDVDDFKVFRDAQGEIAAEEALRKISSILKESATPIDKVSRFSDDGFAIVLPEKNKRDTARTAEELRIKIEEASIGKKKAASHGLTVSAGISENPIDGASAQELVDKAQACLKKAKDEGKNKVAS